MTGEDKPPTEAEVREAELLAQALEDRPGPGPDLASADDALGAAWMVKASRNPGLSELRARAVLERAWPKRSWTARSRAAAAALAVAAAAVAILVVQPRGPARLPPAPVPLLRAQLQATQRGAPAAAVPLEAELAAYRGQLYGALGRAYGTRR